MWLRDFGCGWWGRAGEEVQHGAAQLDEVLSGGGEGTKYLFGGGEGTIRARSLLKCANARTRPTYVCSPVAARSLNHSFGSMKIETETADVCVDEKMHAGSATVDTLFFCPKTSDSLS